MFGFGRERRLTNSERFSHVVRHGRGWATPLFVLKVLPNESPTTRFGVSVSKRLGTAVVRNRVKRRMREIVRTAPVANGWDIVFIARMGAATAEFGAMRDTIHILLRRARLLTSGTEDKP